MTKVYVQATTRAQREAVLKLYRHDNPNWGPGFRVDSKSGLKIKMSTVHYRNFRRQFKPYYGEYIGGNWKGMFVGIEKDGYTHT